jgi:hypothetical protein
MGGSPSGSPSVSTKIAVMAITAVLYAAGKLITAYVPTPWGVGQLLVGVFLPGFMAVTSDTLSVATGAGIGTFIGDFAVQTNPTLSLIAGVPANFIAFLLFGWFVKKYKSWPAFVAGAVAFVTLGNLIAALLVFQFAKSTIGITLPTSAIMGLTVFWNTTSIPAMIIGVPVLIRAIRPLFGRSKVLSQFPEWSTAIGLRQSILAVVFGLLYSVIGGVIFIFAPDSVSAQPGLAYFAIAAVVVIVFAPISGILAGSKTKAT